MPIETVKLWEDREDKKHVNAQWIGPAKKFLMHVIAVETTQTEKNSFEISEQENGL